MPRDIDGLMAVTLKHLRERWWDASFTTFLEDTLQPRPGKRLLDVGCGVGTAELQIGLLRVPQLSLVGVDVDLPSVTQAAGLIAERNLQARVAAGNALALPFSDRVFDGVFCVAVLQHLGDPSIAVREFARVTRPGGRVLVVEPDNAARYWYSSCDSGQRAYAAATAFFSAVERPESHAAPLALGPRVPALLRQSGLEPLFVRVFPVASTRLGAPAETVWHARRRAVQKALARVTGVGRIEALGAACLAALEEYEAEAARAGAAFVEIQHTMLFATAGTRV
jgi:SAM-dependent methyltransferase